MNTWLDMVLCAHFETGRIGELKYAVRAGKARLPRRRCLLRIRSDCEECNCRSDKNREPPTSWIHCSILIRPRACKRTKGFAGSDSEWMVDRCPPQRSPVPRRTGFAIRSFAWLRCLSFCQCWNYVIPSGFPPHVNRPPAKFFARLLIPLRNLLPGICRLFRTIGAQ